MYGGTIGLSLSVFTHSGLSPRVRGNQTVFSPLDAYAGSIPACTGEPIEIPIAPGCREVYPRVYGGTAKTSTGNMIKRGLSPRVRGNRPPRRPRMGPDGSIPACTGEPWLPAFRGTNPGVYPRVYGGTFPELAPVDRVGGLSPRVRGNPGSTPGWTLPLRSIPACTGEPISGIVDIQVATVYPRVYGGTPTGANSDRFIEGLSPRVRGNRSFEIFQIDCKGSIPACTGEPNTSPRARVIPEVYPRVYGGTTE